MARQAVRRVITGTGPDGRSGIGDDRACEAVLETPMFLATDIWVAGCGPANVAGGDLSDGKVVLEPPHCGFLVRRVVFHPDRQWLGSEAYLTALEAAGGGASHVAGAHDDGMHVTRTVDVAYVVEGEIVAVLEGAETTLRAGDSLIQRGTKHAWSNRTDEDAVVLFTQVSTAS